MYLQFTGDIPAVSYNRMDRKIKLVGNGFVGHAFHNTGNDFFFSLAECFLFTLFFFFFVSAQQLVDFSGNGVRIITYREMVIVLDRKSVV